MEVSFNGTYQNRGRGCKQMKVARRTERALFDCLLFRGPLVGVCGSFLFVAWTAVAKIDGLQRLGRIEPMARCHQKRIEASDKENSSGGKVGAKEGDGGGFLCLK
ncbi:hypothetical protein BDV32DRAFT_78475 [Aspergillus pseudonomiae]|nr:hypothetical protein BDV32DRAFT_78475 [Aspergillus pseudonomiae]